MALRMKLPASPLAASRSSRAGLYLSREHAVSEVREAAFDVSELLLWTAPAASLPTLRRTAVTCLRFVGIMPDAPLRLTHSLGAAPAPIRLEAGTKRHSLDPPRQAYQVGFSGLQAGPCQTAVAVLRDHLAGDTPALGDEARAVAGE